MIDKDFISAIINDEKVPITHKRSCMKFYYEYLINRNLIDDAKELLELIKNNKEVVEYCLREKWYLQHKYYYKQKEKKKKMMIEKIETMKEKNE